MDLTLQTLELDEIAAKEALEHLTLHCLIPCARCNAAGCGRKGERCEEGLWLEARAVEAKRRLRTATSEAA